MPFSEPVLDALKFEYDWPQTVDAAVYRNAFFLEPWQVATES
jgi:hypothetical protein